MNDRFQGKALGCPTTAVTGQEGFHGYPDMFTFAVYELAGCICYDKQGGIPAFVSYVFNDSLLRCRWTRIRGAIGIGSGGVFLGKRADRMISANVTV